LREGLVDQVAGPGLAIEAQERALHQHCRSVARQHEVWLARHDQHRRLGVERRPDQRRGQARRRPRDDGRVELAAVDLAGEIGRLPGEQGHFEFGVLMRIDDPDRELHDRSLKFFRHSTEELFALPFVSASR
jgi:hypothetical protein